MIPFLACGELSKWLGNQDVRCKQGKFVIDFRSSQVRHMLLCIHLTVMKNALKNVLHCIKLLQSLHRLDNSFIIGYSTSLTQYLTYSTSLPQDTFDLLYFNFFSLIEMFINVYGQIYGCMEHCIKDLSVKTTAGAQSRRKLLMLIYSTQTSIANLKGVYPSY